MAIRMVIERVNSEDIFCPAILCDYCGKRIAKSGNYEWEMDANGLVVTGEIFYTHKECCRAFETAHGERSRWYCAELDCLPNHLAGNLELKM